MRPLHIIGSNDISIIARSHLDVSVPYGMEKRIENVNPQVFAKAHERVVLPDEENDSVRDEIDAREIFGMFMSERHCLAMRLARVYTPAYTRP